MYKIYFFWWEMSLKQVTRDAFWNALRIMCAIFLLRIQQRTLNFKLVVDLYNHRSVFHVNWIWVVDTNVTWETSPNFFLVQLLVEVNNIYLCILRKIVIRVTSDICIVPLLIIQFLTYVDLFFELTIRSQEILNDCERFSVLTLTTTCGSGNILNSWKLYWLDQFF